MSKRLGKQFIIVLVFVFILSVIAFLIYYATRPEPTCLDGIQNQDETGIDCGGVCPPCELIHPEEISVLQTEAVLAEEDFYDVLVKVKNANQNSGSGQVNYTIKLYSRDGGVIGERSGRTFILPNQTKYIVELKIESTDVVSDIQVSFGEIEWQQLSGESPQLTVSRKEYSQLGDDYLGRSQVKGVVVNKGSLSFDKIYIDILLFDSKHRLIGLNIAEVNTLLAGQERDFSAVWFRDLPEVSSIETEAETNIFDTTNVIKKTYDDVNRFQEY